MGQNRRYGSDVTWAAIADAVLRPQPTSLTHAEIGADPASIPLAPEPVRVSAWVLFPQGTVKVEGRAIAWHGRAVCVHFVMRDGTDHRAWVWASAIDRLP